MRVCLLCSVLNLTVSDSRSRLLSLYQETCNRGPVLKIHGSLIMGILPSNISQRKRKKKEEKEENAISIKFLVFNIGPP